VSAAIGTVAVLVLAACGSQSSSDSTPASPAAAPLAGTSWVLTSYTGSDGAQVPAVASANMATLTFDAYGAFNGSTGCNRIIGSYTQDGASLTMEPGPMTLMACIGDAGPQEAAIVAALPTVASFSDGDTLVLKAADGAPLLTYSAGLTSLEGTSWQATGINNGKQAVVAQAGTEKVTAVFGTDGSLTGSGGCNNYTGTFTTSGSDQITIGPVAATAMACEGAAGQIESEYFAALGNVATYQIEGNTLTLRDAEGATQVTYVRTA
jgi:heat shock protein HslJ